VPRFAGRATPLDWGARPQALTYGASFASAAADRPPPTAATPLALADRSEQTDMERRVLLSALMGIAVLASRPAAAAAEYERPAGPTLKELAARRGVEIGANFPSLVFGKSPNNWTDSPTAPVEQAIAADQFTIMTAGWEMYPGKSWKGPGQYDLAGFDAVVAWCRQRGIQVHGHGLGYACRVEWFKKLPCGQDSDRAEVRRIYEGYLRDTAARYAGKVQLWDVCNEQLLAPYQSGGFRTSECYWKAYQSDASDPKSGVEWYRRSFRLAHEADPQARLILLEFNNEIVCPKSDFLYELAKALQAEGVPIHGVGFQMHLDTELRRGKGTGMATDEEYFDSMADNFRRFSQLGLELWITEMDVAIDPQKDIDAELERQAMIFGRVAEIALGTANFRGLKYWGIMDKNTWGQVSPERPHLFDDSGRAKPAFRAVQQAFIEAAARD
jgi:endo-1,4-beta-xylanase